MSATRRHGFEPWAFGAFAIAAATAGLYLFLGSRPGGAGPVLAYRFGLLGLGWVAAVGMLAALAWSLRRRPVLQRGRAWALGALGASLWFCSLPIAYPSSHEGKFSATPFALPFEGAARVRYGGEHASRNPLVFDPARRFGTGFERAGGSALTVVAPAAGTLLVREPGREGERLVLAVGEHEFFVLEGLDPGSCALVRGDRVVPGARLGLASGLLYAHLQDAPVPGRGEGIPLRYRDYVADGRMAESGVPVPPQALERAAPRGPLPPGR